MSHLLQIDFGRVVTTISRRIIGRCRNIAFSWDKRYPTFLSVLEEVVRFSSTAGENPAIKSIVVQVFSKASVGLPERRPATRHRHQQ